MHTHAANVLFLIQLLASIASANVRHCLVEMEPQGVTAQAHVVVVPDAHFAFSVF